MRNKEEIIKELRNLITKNKLSIYSIAKITGINRSTLQKAMTGDRNLSLRQFQTIIKILPITNDERALLYNDYMQYTWTNERLETNTCMLDILSTITEILDGRTVELPQPDDREYNGTYYSGDDVKAVIEHILMDKLMNNEPSPLYIYIPFFNSFFEENILPITSHTNCKVSVIFDILKNNDYSNLRNLVTFKNILPLLLDTKDKYTLNYNYIEGYNYINQPILYPFHIILQDKAILLSGSLDSAIIIDNAKTIDNMIDRHIQQLKNTTPLNSAQLDIISELAFLTESNKKGDNIYSINYEPCISTFVPLELLTNLISDDFYKKDELISTISARLDQISSVGKKYCIFNSKSIDDFVETGNILACSHPHLRCCTLQERKIILENIIASMENRNTILRAFTSENINVSKHYEITDIRSNDTLNIIIYLEAGTIKMLSIQQPFVSQNFISFIKDIMDTRRTFGQKDTMALFQRAVERIDSMIADEKGNM